LGQEEVRVKIKNGFLNKLWEAFPEMGPKAKFLRSQSYGAIFPFRSNSSPV